MEISTPLSVKFGEKKTPPKFCKLTPLSVKFENKNATKILFKKSFSTDLPKVIFEKNDD